MKKLSLAGLAALAVLVAGCPHNDYTVKLTPRGKIIERKLEFYRADGADTNGVPKYESFPSNELAVITALYPTGKVTHQDDRHFASGEFSDAMPHDVGGTGTYDYFTTSLGTAAFYGERFRGNDDLAARAKARLAAADQLTDLLLGWSRAELGREPGYKNLRRFLDGEVRHDLRNLGLYCWAGEISSSYKHEAGEEFMVRFGQYLRERGYLKREDAAGLAQFDSGGSGSQVLLLVQKIVAEKLGVPAQTLPKAMGFLTDSTVMEKSWEKYLTGTELYQARLRQWKKEKKLKPDLQKPEPSEVMNELLSTLLNVGLSDEDDRLTVRLALDFAPNHTNGKWDEARHQVVWESNLEAQSPARRLPVFCYASWSQPDENFQEEHFGRVILRGDELLKYCMWHSGLAEKQSDEWEKFLSGMKPDEALDKTLEVFRFADNSSAADMGKGLLKAALQQKK